jgi:hypothetical protein
MRHGLYFLTGKHIGRPVMYPEFRLSNGTGFKLVSVTFAAKLCNYVCPSTSIREKYSLVRSLLTSRSIGITNKYKEVKIAFEPFVHTKDLKHQMALNLIEFPSKRHQIKSCCRDDDIG